jgi:signal transduction histidine kinase
VTVALAIATGVSFLVTGWIAERRRPENRTGRIMLFAGAMWLVSALAEADAPLWFTIGTALVTVGKAALVHLLLAFPEGRLRSRLDRGLVAVGYVVTVPGGIATLAFTDDARNLILVADDPAMADALHQLQRAVGFAVVVGAAIVLARRWRGASPPLRRALAPVLAAGAVAIALVAATLVASQLSGPLYDALGVVQVAAFAAVPVAFLVGLLRSWLSRTTVAELIVELRSPLPPGGLRAALRRTLGDPSLELAYRVGDGYVDLDGRPVDVEEPGRAVTVAEHGGRPVAALVHDPSLREAPELLDAACAAAALALENERLQAELRARLEDLRASRARIVAAGDEERRRLERNLHDGAQQRLVSLALALGLAEDMLAADEDPAEAREVVATAKGELRAAIDELRELAHGLHPAVLSERGLPMALEALAQRAHVPVELDVPDERLPPPVEAALYYVASEALANAAKHARAQRMSVQLGRRNGSVVLAVRDDGIGGAALEGGSGLRGLADRVEALDGELTVDSRSGEGTVLRAEIPCGS